MWNIYSKQIKEQLSEFERLESIETEDGLYIIKQSNPLLSRIDIDQFKTGEIEEKDIKFKVHEEIIA